MPWFSRLADSRRVLNAWSILSKIVLRQKNYKITVVLEGVSI
jgi:hypothetical protein